MQELVEEIKQEVIRRKNMYSQNALNENYLNAAFLRGKAAAMEDMVRLVARLEKKLMEIEDDLK